MTLSGCGDLQHDAWNFGAGRGRLGFHEVESVRYVFEDPVIVLEIDAKVAQITVVFKKSIAQLSNTIKRQRFYWLRGRFKTGT